MANGLLKIDVDSVLRTRLSTRYCYIPRFVIRWLERTICQDQLNDILTKMSGKNGVDAATVALDDMGVKVDATGLDNLPEGRFMFVSNHPLGGLDGLALISLLGNRYDRKIKFLVNDLDFAPDQMIVFRGYDGAGKLKAMYGLFDFGSGTIDGVSLAKTLAGGATTLHYVFDVSKNKYMVLTFVSEVEFLPHVSYPRLVAEKGRIPGQFDSKFDTLDNLTPELGDEIGDDDLDDEGDSE